MSIKYLELHFLQQHEDYGTTKDAHHGVPLPQVACYGNNQGYELGKPKGTGGKIHVFEAVNQEDGHNHGGDVFFDEAEDRRWFSLGKKGKGKESGGKDHQGCYDGGKEGIVQSKGHFRTPG